jgi:hypothetical protein
MQPKYIFRNADLSDFFWSKCLFQPMQFPFFFLSTNEKVFRQLGANPSPFSPKESMLANQPRWIHKKREKKLIFMTNVNNKKKKVGICA